MKLTEAEYAALLARDTGGRRAAQSCAIARERQTQQRVPQRRESIMSQGVIAESSLVLPTAFDVTLTLPWPPSVNASLVYGNRGRMVARKAIWAYRAAVCVAVDAQWPTSLFRPLSQRLALHMVLYPVTKRRFDLDNRLKILQDCLSTDARSSSRPRAAVYLDDSQIDHLSVTRGPIVADAAYVTVQLTPFP